MRPPRISAEYRYTAVAQQGIGDDGTNGVHDSSGSSRDEVAAVGCASHIRRWWWLLLSITVLLLQLAVNAVHLLSSPSQPQLWSLLPFALPSDLPLSPPEAHCERAALPLATTLSADAPFMAWATQERPLLLSCAGDGRLAIRGASWGSLCGWHPSTGLGAKCPWTTYGEDEDDDQPTSSPAEGVTQPAAEICRVVHLTTGMRQLCDGRAACAVQTARLSQAADVCPGSAKMLVASWSCTAAVAGQPLLPNRSISDLSEAWAEQRAQPPVSKAARAVAIRGARGPRECSLVISSQVNISGFGNWWAGGGLWNQLVNVQQMAVMAWSAGCGLSVTAFLPDYNSATEVRFGSVFALDAINERLCTAHQTALLHPDASFFRAARGSACASSIPPLRLSDALVPGGWPGWEGTVSPTMSLWMKMSIRGEGHSVFYDAVARALQTHSDPGHLWLRGGWDGWAGLEGTLPGLAMLRELFVDALEFTPPFVHTVEALQRLMGVESGGRFTFVHFRVEPDLAIMAAHTPLTTEQYTDRMYEQLVEALDCMLDPPQPASAAQAAMAKRIRAWPIYLGTGVLVANPWVRRFKQRYPWATVYTKDVFLYDHCDLSPGEGLTVQSVQARPAGLSDAAHAALLQRFAAAAHSLPWSAGVGECTWLQNAVKGEEGKPNREYWALLDWMLTREVSHFLGPTKSSFTVNTVAAIQRRPRRFTHTNERGEAESYEQFAWGLPPFPGS